MRLPLAVALLVFAAYASAQNATLSPTSPISSTVDITSQPGCSAPGSDVLPLGLTSCSLSGFLNINTTLKFSFATAANGTHNVLFILRTLQGEASMGVWSPRDSADPDPNASPSIYGQMIYSTATAIESYLYLTPDMLSQNGTYTLGIRSTTSSPFYSLTVLTPSVNLTLAASDAAALKTIHEECCPNSNSVGMFAGTNYCRSGLFLSASDPTRTARQDICNMPPFACNEQGQLVRFIAPSAGLTCSRGLPDAFANFTALQALDLSGNSLTDSTGHVSVVVKQMKDLRRLYLRSANIDGTLMCDLVGEKLEVLTMSSNALTGPLPACITGAPALQELYLSLNSIAGPLPDNLNVSKLNVFYALGQKGRMLTGPLPPTITQSSLKYLALAANALSGPLPAMPSTLVTLNISDNEFVGKIPDLPKSLVAVDLSMNKLNGTLPAEMPGLLLGDFSYNQLSGTLASLPTTATGIDVSNNSLSGPLPAFPDTLASFAADNNRFSGNVSALGFNQARYVTLANNQLSGSLTTQLMTSPQLSVLDLSGNQIEGVIPTIINMPALQGLYLEDNKLSGPIPGSIFSLPFLHELDLSHNSLTGDLTAAGAAVAAAPVNYISALDISNNKLTGGVPQELSKLAVFDPTRGDLLGPNLLPLPRVFIISNNSLSGDFPTYVLSSFAQIVDFCSELQCNAAASISGDDMWLNCPDLNSININGNVSVLAPFGMECVTSKSAKINIVDYILAATPVSSSMVSSRNSEPLNYGIYTGSPVTSSPGGSNLNTGGIVGLTIGLLVAVVLMAVIAYFVGYKRFYKERQAQNFERMEHDSAHADGCDLSTEMTAQGANRV